MGARDLTEEPGGPVSVGTVFERFPASVRGAIVARAQDREPHQVRLLAVRVVQAHDLSRDVHRAAVDQATVDVPPHKEVLIPFDVPFSELGPGWFCVVADVEVDGRVKVTGPEGGGKRFGVPWPTEEVRKADVKPNLKVGGALIERIRSTPDGIEIRWRPPRVAEAAQLKVRAGRQRLPVVDVTDDPRTGLRTSVGHPLPRNTAEVTLEVLEGRKSKTSTTLDLE